MSCSKMVRLRRNCPKLPRWIDLNTAQHCSGAQSWPFSRTSPCTMPPQYHQTRRSTFFEWGFRFGIGMGHCLRVSHLFRRLSLFSKSHFSSQVQILFRNGWLRWRSSWEFETSTHLYFWLQVRSYGTHLPCRIHPFLNNNLPFFQYYATFRTSSRGTAEVAGQHAGTCGGIRFSSAENRSKIKLLWSSGMGYVLEFFLSLTKLCEPSPLRSNSNSWRALTCTSDFEGFILKPGTSLLFIIARIYAFQRCTDPMNPVVNHLLQLQGWLSENSGNLWNILINERFHFSF